MNFITVGLEHAWRSIKKHPLLFMILVIFHAALIGIMIYLLLNYPAQILQDVQGIMQPLENANYNATSIQEGAAFSPELSRVFESYNSLTSRVYQLCLWFSVIFVFLQAAIWILAVRLVKEANEEEIKSFFKAWGTYLLTGILFSIVPLLICYFILLTFFNIESTNTAVGLLWLVAAILVIFFYFSQVGFALIYSKNCFRNWVKVTFKKIHYSLAILLINLIVIGILGTGAFLLMEYDSWFPLVLILTILLFFTLIFALIFWASYVHLQTQNHEKNHH
jgi:hypothetical protein